MPKIRVLVPSLGHNRSTMGVFQQAVGLSLFLLYRKLDLLLLCHKETFRCYVSFSNLRGRTKLVRIPARVRTCRKTCLPEVTLGDYRSTNPVSGDRL